LTLRQSLHSRSDRGIAALANHALETALLGHTQQRQTVIEALQQSLQARLASHQRLQTKITAIERKQFNAHRWMVPSHVQPGKVRIAVGIAGNNLALENGRLRRQLAQQLCDGTMRPGRAFWAARR
jgi:hypothetical protein